MTTSRLAVALYARYSSDNQSESSIGDQLRVCHSRASREGWDVVETYTDAALSGATLLRAGMQKLLADARAGRFKVVLTEALDRLSRDQADTANIFKHLSFLGVEIVTLEEGVISELHVGLKGTMNALYLKSLADKTRRGQRGVVDQGRVAGGLCYGYKVVPDLDARGNRVGGRREIDAGEAEIVRRIFRAYVGGFSAFEIVKQLNTDGVAPPGAARRRVDGAGPPRWNASTLLGNPKRRNGLLNNEMYVGRIVWNRQRFVKDPDTGRRQARPNPPSEWVTRAAPELRILEDDLWDAAQTRLRSMATVRRPDQARRPKHLFSGLMSCGRCGGSYSVYTRDHLGCSSARNNGSCTNRRMVRIDAVETRILDGLRAMMATEDAADAFAREYRAAKTLARTDSETAHRADLKARADLERQIARLVDVIANSTGDPAPLLARLKDLQGKIADVEQRIAVQPAKVVELHPHAFDLYLRVVDQLKETLQGADAADRREAAEILRQLVTGIIVHPGARPGEVSLELLGNADAIAALTNTNPERLGVPVTVKMVAGAGFEPTTFRL
ncbi:MAG: recombinase family protein [Rhodospirillaceae bacterium]|nr:recombinase family protein [Rhodospirillaceae bacterium]